MTNIRHSRTTSDTWFNRGTPAPFETNRRMSIRYLRNDIGVTVRKIGLFNFTFLMHKNSSVKLIDISSRGVLIATNMRLATNKKIILTLRFADFREFEVPGKVVRKSIGELQFYGIKFDHLNDALADHLLATQRKLAFK
ncbi:MAG: PilZ domain-containing protein [Methylococcaceae bacterium]|nr:PilZ domain-containing protein [Methylococcaceae bacterium]